MRLKHIKLSGFKSFVDPTTVGFPGNLTGIVGPNGCGKSNIIDAVRWVMGESSAKYLRGESMADVIFNGSTNRKPAGQASIELHFDNHDGSLGGMYAQYPEIVVRRQVSHDGQSVYYLNNAVCRRRDITDIFLGTGLGPRSYAIIEQGMISRLIEAKPEELRVYLEEAAGISKYKERRRETELRLQHTRDNLARLSDIRDELQKQLDRLSKQAETAEKYQELKDQEKKLRAELLSLRARNLENEIQSEQEAIRILENQLEQYNTEFQHLATTREAEQQNHTEKNEVVQKVQKEFYEANTKLARLEEQIQHHREQKRQLDANLLQVQQELQQSDVQYTQEKNRREALQVSHDNVLPQVSAAKEKLTQSQQTLKEMEAYFHQWQQRWDEFNQESSKHLQAAQVEQTKIQHLEKHIQTIEERIQRLTQEKEKYAELSLSSTEISTLQQQIQIEQEALSQLHEKLQEQRNLNQELHKTLDQHRTDLQSLRGRFSSLQALQEAALGKNVESTQQWLKENQLENKSRLAEKLKVQEGWEFAVETVLNRRLEAVELDGAVSIEIKPNSLASICQGPSTVLNLLTDVYMVNSWQEALEKLPTLDAKASMITQEGIWIGQGWLCAMKSHDQKDSVILRERLLNELQQDISTKTDAVTHAQSLLEENQNLLRQLEISRDEKQKVISQLSSKFADLSAQLKAQEARLVQILKELDELNLQKMQEDEALVKSRETWQSALKIIEEDTQKRESLQKTREEEQSKLRQAREAFQVLQQETHSLSTQLEVLQTQQKASDGLCERLQSQIQTLQSKLSNLKTQSETFAPQEMHYVEELNQLLAIQQELEKHVQAKRAELSACEEQLRTLEKQQQECEGKRSEIRSQLEQKRLALQSATVRMNTIHEQLQEMGCELQTLLAELSPDANEAQTEELLTKTINRIERLGPINLAAISEHAQQMERKQYLDQQNDDLISALGMLEDAISKIDRETKNRFKEIYDQVNGLFQELFPRIFGGGQAYLELTGEDLLETGVSVMARPPGKKNSTIHLLSGGEKALTAIALVFSIFQLNPAPFCMLDEVDAPLDDANVGRFCELVKEMSKTVQFIFISHNKLAIEMAEHLVGVTMNEPGVSRLVAVDVKAAMEMAEA